MTLISGGVGVFPGARRARVIWAGLSGEIERLSEFQNDLDARLADIGFARDARAFNAHLTIGRFRRAPDPAKLREALNRFAGAEFGCLEVREIILFRSELNPGGALYTQLQRVTLGRPPV
jgi:2'-5' RNA ligase